jgi:carboxymethylenebutenolidase
MCFDHDSHPPIEPIAGGAIDVELVELEAADGNRLAGFRARPAAPTGRGVVLLPDVRGLHPFYEELAMRFAEHGIDALAIDWYGRTANDGRRGLGFDHAPHVAAVTWAGIAADIRAGVAALRDRGLERVFTVGFCMGGRMSFLAATLGLGLTGVIGLYGTLEGPGRGNAPAPLDLLDEIAAPVLGLFGGADEAITPDVVRALDQGLTERGVEHRIQTYRGAPHSFFDRKQTEFADASAAAWDEITAFIEQRRR